MNPVPTTVARPRRAVDRVRMWRRFERRRRWRWLVRLLGLLGAAVGH